MNDSIKMFKIKSYEVYDEYLKHQSSKLNNTPYYRNPLNYDNDFCCSLKKRIPKFNRDSKVLCLGARLGGEVRAFLESGYFAVGIDINPGQRNPFVLYGDFHHTQFPSHSVDVIYTNSFDHVLNPDKFMDEVNRILTPKGTFMIEVIYGSEEGGDYGEYETLSWPTIEQLSNFFQTYSFKLVTEIQINLPWKGKQLRLDKT